MLVMWVRVMAVGVLGRGVHSRGSYASGWREGAQKAAALAGKLGKVISCGGHVLRVVVAVSAWCRKGRCASVLVFVAALR